MNKNIMQDADYVNIVSEFLSNPNIQKLKNIPHHDSNRFNHSLKVSYYSYKICKKLNLNYKSAAKAGILHDLYFNRTTDYKKIKDKIKLYTNAHPETALKNAKAITDLTELETDIIISHMWPLSTHFPKHKESLLLGTVDAVISTKEFVSKFNYKLSYVIGVYFIFLCCFVFKSNI